MVYSKKRGDKTSRGFSRRSSAGYRKLGYRMFYHKLQRLGIIAMYHYRACSKGEAARGEGRGFSLEEGAFPTAGSVGRAAKGCLEMRLRLCL